MTNEYMAAPGTPIKIENFEGAKQAASAGMDPALLALMNNGNGGFGGGQNSMWLLLLLLLGGNRGGGLFGGNGSPADAVAAVSAMTPKDIAAQLNTLGLTNCNSFHELQEAICALGRSGDQNTASVIQGQSAQNLNACQSTASIIAGQAAQNMSAAQSQAAITTAITNGQFALAQQLAKCCCDNQLATVQTQNLVNTSALQTQNQSLAGFAALSNQLNLQTCAIEKAIAAGTDEIDDKLCAMENDSLRQRLADAHNTISSLTSTGATSQIVGGAVDRLSALIRSCPCDTKSKAS